MMKIRQSAADIPPIILNCHLCGPSELGKVVMVASLAKVKVFYFQIKPVIDHGLDWCTTAV